MFLKEIRSLFLSYVPHRIKTHEKHPEIVKMSKKSCFLNFKRGQGNLGRLVPGCFIYRLLIIVIPKIIHFLLVHNNFFLHAQKSF